MTLRDWAYHRSMGYAARQADRPVIACPYPEGTTAANAWVQGWQLAHKAAEHHVNPVPYMGLVACYKPLQESLKARAEEEKEAMRADATHGRMSR